ncbi:MAG: SAM-dependent methyltransferase [Lachnospiraceae bacterium]|nr:SAM-dependent methyltransferase [Lachnospiraceae bacterium]
MKGYILSKRLTKVAKLVEPAAFLVDIGCDHGFLSIELVSNGVVKKALCTDINEGPLSRADDHIKEYGLEERISTLLSDGLLAIKDREDEYPFDAACICGMGGLMGIKIMHEAAGFFKKMNKVYLQLQSDIELVRIYLEASGYKTEFEDMVFEDGKYYTVIKAHYDNKDKSDGVGLDDIGAMDFSIVPEILKKKYDALSIEDSLNYKYNQYEGMDEEVYKDFLEFMIDKYNTIRSFLPDDSERVPVIEKELEIMKMAYSRIK